MKGFKKFGLMVVAVAAMLVALPTSGAFAAKHLILTEGGVPVATGSPADTGLLVAGCTVFSEGTVSVNESGKDKLNATKNAMESCEEEGASVTGIVTETALSVSGKATLKAKLTVTKPGPCVYGFKKFKTTFAIPGVLFLEGTTTGKINKKISSPSCATEVTEPFFADATNEVFGEAFGDEL